MKFVNLALVAVLAHLAAGLPISHNSHGLAGGVAVQPSLEPQQQVLDDLAIRLQSSDHTPAVGGGKSQLSTSIADSERQINDALDVAAKALALYAHTGASLVFGNTFLNPLVHSVLAGAEAIYAHLTGTAGAADSVGSYVRGAYTSSLQRLSKQAKAVGIDTGKLDGVAYKIQTMVPPTPLAVKAQIKLQELRRLAA